MRRAAFLVILLICCSACGGQAPRFSLENARAHVQMLAGTIGSRPIGTPENQRARQYIVDQLRLYGFEVRVQETDARRPDLGLTARVANIIAVRAGAERSAIALLSHYDSAAESPGGGDDGFGVAVSLEAARVLAARTDRRHSLMVLITDGEEEGLMGAAGLVADREVMARLGAYVNVESSGSSGTAILFQAGPQNGWIVKPWARHAAANAADWPPSTRDWRAPSRSPTAPARWQGSAHRAAALGAPPRAHGRCPANGGRWRATTRPSPMLRGAAAIRPVPPRSARSGPR